MDLGLGTWKLDPISISRANRSHPINQSPRHSLLGILLMSPVFVWYSLHDLPVTPINPTSTSITALKKEFPTLPNLSALPNPKETSVSIITPPAATLKVLQEAKELGIPAVWMQPGTFDSEVMKFARAEGAFQAVVGGDGGRGNEGWCVLVDGERALKGAGKL